jgi:CopG family transcriptional regulator, nickel-responsive regulator
MRLARRHTICYHSSTIIQIYSLPGWKNMSDNNLVRFGVSISTGLLNKFDSLIRDKEYTNRSEAIRDIIRDKLVEAKWERGDDSLLIGNITIVYDHHTREIGERLTAIAHDHHALIISSMHVHLTHASCMEVTLVKGPGSEIRSFADSIISVRGVQHGKLVVTSPVEDELDQSD